MDILANNKNLYYPLLLTNFLFSFHSACERQRRLAFRIAEAREEIEGYSRTRKGIGGCSKRR